MKGFSVIIALMLSCFASTVFTQDLTATYNAKQKKVFVTLQLAPGQQMVDLLSEYGLASNLSAKTIKQGSSVFLLPLSEIRMATGENKIWFRTEKAGKLSEIADQLGLQTNELMALNNMQSDYVPARKYLVLGFVGQPKVNVKPEPTNTDTAAKTEKNQGKPSGIEPIVSKPDSVAGLPVPVGAGYFEVEFVAKNHLLKAGKMGLFKTLGGWYDRKYYALSNDVPVGSVLKVTNAANGKYVYAKVVSGMPGLKEDRNLMLRLNDAGRAALDVWNEDEVVQVQISD